MQLVEQHVIGKNDLRYSVIDEAAFKSKNLYNAGNYEIRQSYILQGKYLNYNEMDRRMQSYEAYKSLPAKVSQQVLMHRKRATHHKHRSWTWTHCQCMIRTRVMRSTHLAASGSLVDSIVLKMDERSTPILTGQATSYEK